MCGLVSVISKYSNGFTKEQCDIFDHLLFIDQLRGKDSTGVFLVDKENNMDLAKEAVHATDFRTKKEYGDLLTKAFQRGSALVGHNRAATKGIVNDANAHPFVVDDRITLVHNGTLWGDHKKLADTEVDSHAIAHVIHNNGNDIEKALKELSGAYALIWHDFENKAINFVRNSQRPLFWIDIPGAWVWASESNMLEWVISKFNLRPEADPQMLPENNLCTFTQNKGSWELSNKKLDLTKVYTGQTSDPIRHYQDAWDIGTHRPDMSRLANGYFAHENDVDTSSPFEDDPNIIVSPSEKTNITQVSKPASNPVTKRIEDFEEAFAHEMGNAMTFPKFGNLSLPFKDGSYLEIRCKEVLEVSINNPQLGCFLYGTLEEEPDMIVKIHMSPLTSETDLLDLSVNERRALVKMRSRQWKPYSTKMSKGSGIGYGMITCEFVKELEEKEVAKA